MRFGQASHLVNIAVDTLISKKYTDNVTFDKAMREVLLDCVVPDCCKDSHRDYFDEMLSDYGADPINFVNAKIKTFANIFNSLDKSKQDLLKFNIEHIHGVKHVPPEFYIGELNIDKPSITFWLEDIFSKEGRGFILAADKIRDEIYLHKDYKKKDLFYIYD